MRTVLILAALIAAASCATPVQDTANAEQDAGIDARPALPGQADLGFAVAQLCRPYLTQNAGEAAITDRPGVTPNNGSDPVEYWVGQPNLTVRFDDDGTVRSCTLKLNDGDPAQYRARLLAALEREWPVALSPAPSTAFAAGPYANRELFCAPPDGPQDGVLISTNEPGAYPALMATLSRLPARSGRC